MAPVLAYWDIRGLAEYIRYLLAYAEVEYEDKRYKYGPAPEYSRDEWLSEKFKLGLDFPNIPYYIDGDLKLTQSVVIMRYLARKFNLMPETEDDTLRVELIEQQSMETLVGCIRLCYNPGFSEKIKQEWLEKFDVIVKHIAVILSGKKFVAGDKVTYVDFLALEALDSVRFLNKDVYKNYPVIVEYIARVKGLKGVKEYLASPNFKSWPWWSPYAKFGGPQDPEPEL